MSSPTGALRPGDTFGPYQLVRQLAVGGMAEIYLARATGISGFEKYVALKMILPNYAEDEHFIEMLVEEAKIVVHLTQPNIVQIFDLGRIGDIHYIAMEYVDGLDLYQLMRTLTEAGHQLAVDVAAFLAHEVCAALDYAHRCRDQAGRPLRIIHRDISPQNIIISRAGEVKLADFGIAKATVRARHTAVGVIKGKYYYMSPEQAWGDAVDHRTDIFSTGVVLYETLVGQMLYLDEDIGVLLDKVRKADIQPPSRLRPDIPPPLERIVMKAVAQRPEDRFASAHDFQAELQRFLYSYAPSFNVGRVREAVERALKLAVRKRTFDLGGPDSSVGTAEIGSVGTAEIGEESLMSVQEYLPLSTHSLLSVEEVASGAAASDDDEFADETVVSEPPMMFDHPGDVAPILPVSVDFLELDADAAPMAGWEDAEVTTAVVAHDPLAAPPAAPVAGMPERVSQEQTLPSMPKVGSDSGRPAPAPLAPVLPPAAPPQDGVPGRVTSKGLPSAAMALPPIPEASPGPAQRAAPAPAASFPGPAMAPGSPPPVLTGPGAGFDVTFGTGEGDAREMEQKLAQTRRQRYFILIGVAVCLVLLIIGVFILSVREAATEPGSVKVITIPPGAKVYYRGKLVGRTPLRLDSLRLDEVHWVRLVSDTCESKGVRLNVKAGEVQTIKVKLEHCDR